MHLVLKLFLILLVLFICAITYQLNNIKDRLLSLEMSRRDFDRYFVPNINNIIYYIDEINKSNIDKLCKKHNLEFVQERIEFQCDKQIVSGVSNHHNLICKKCDLTLSMNNKSKYFAVRNAIQYHRCPKDMQ